MDSPVPISSMRFPVASSCKDCSLSSLFSLPYWFPMSIAFCVLMISLPTTSLRVKLQPERYSANVPITKDGCFCSGSIQLWLDLPFGEFVLSRITPHSGREARVESECGENSGGTRHSARNLGTVNISINLNTSCYRQWASGCPRTMMTDALRRQSGAASTEANPGA